MKNIFLYTLTVLIWGSTWFAIEFQLGVVANEVSLTYRFGLSAALMWLFCWWKKLPMKFIAKDHFFILLLAGFNFAFNYLVLYWAQEYLTSAMSSIAFSTLLLINILNTRLFFNKAIAGRIYLGALIGIAGITFLFANDLRDFSFDNHSIIGLSLSLLGTLIASLGNMVSVRNSNHGLGVLQVNAWGMFYGTILLTVFAVFNGSAFTFSLHPGYIISLIYLSVFGTVIAFACYFVLFKNIGPEKASYVIVLFPFVAVILSSFFEDFQWESNTVIGFALVLIGNAIVLTPYHRLKSVFQTLVLDTNTNAKTSIKEDKVHEVSR